MYELEHIKGALGDDGILVVTIAREAAKNALDTATIRQLDEVIAKAGTNETVRAVVITGAGKVFGIGADIPEIAKAGADRDAMGAMIRAGNATYRRIETLNKPVCAAINGIFALGGSLELALACHFRVASKRVRMGLPEVTLGLIPGYGGTQRLPRMIGQARALELILTGEPIKAEEAHAIGLVNQVTEPGEEVTAAKALLARALKNGPRALEAAINAVVNGMDLPWDQSINIETLQFLNVRATRDAAEGLAAQQENRKPSFKGE